MVLLRRLHITGRSVGGMQTTQECMDFCAKNNILCKTEVIDSIAGIDAAGEKLVQGNDTGVRYVVDIEKALK